MDEQKNFLTAMVLSGLILLGYWYFYLIPTQEAAKANVEAEQVRVEAEQQASVQAPVIEEIISREAALADNGIDRIQISTPSFKGSFRVKGSRFDDIELKNYKATLEADSGNVILLTPENADKAAYVFDNWVTAEGGSGADTHWIVTSGKTLTPDAPVKMVHEAKGFSVERTVTVDDRYLITLSDKVTNTSGGEINLIRKGASRQHGLPDDLTNFFILQEGPVAIVDGKLEKMKYKKLSKKRKAVFAGESGWAGLTDKYWLQATVPPQATQVETGFDFKIINNRGVYETNYATAETTLTAGASINSVGYVFAGAKDRETLLSYQNDIGISEMERAIDWGALRLLTRPMTQALSFLGHKLGNFGIGIMVLTLILKIFMFPLFNKQYASQAKMKKVQPKLKKIQTMYKDDRAKLQKEMMALYKKEGVNPMAGCLPIIPTIFIFFALYKSVFINVDMRHAPFFGWIQDLSAKDPLSILNGFGALPWGPEPFGLALLAIGPLALLYGITMALMQTLTPMPGAGAAPPKEGDAPDMMAMQGKIFKWMPWFFMFILAPFATGLLVYWVWNNILSFAQQYYITRKFKVDTPIDKFFRKITGKPEPEEAS